MQDLTRGVEDLDVSNDRSCTSILTSHPQSRDIHLESFTLLFHGHELLTDTDLELNFGRQPPSPVTHLVPSSAGAEECVQTHQVAWQYWC